MKRLSRGTTATLQLAIGACPSCAVWVAAGMASRSVVYRRSNRSITMRCEVCGLQWTVTYAKLHAAMKRQLAGGLDPDTAALYERIAELTEFAAKNETRGRKSSTGGLADQ